MRKYIYLLSIPVFLFLYSAAAKAQMPSNSIIMESVYNGQTHDLLASPEGKVFFAKTYHNEVADSLLLELHRLDGNGKVAWKKRYKCLAPLSSPGNTYSLALKAHFLDRNTLVYQWFAGYSSTQRLYQLMIDTLGNVQTSRYYDNVKGLGADVLLVPNGNSGYFLTGNYYGFNSIEPMIYQFNKNGDLVKVKMVSTNYLSIFPGIGGYVFNFGERQGASLYFSARIIEADGSIKFHNLIIRTDTNLYVKNSTIVYSPKDSGFNNLSEVYGIIALAPNRILSFSSRKRNFITELDSNLNPVKAVVFTPQDQTPAGFGNSSTYYHHTFANGTAGFKNFSYQSILEINDSLKMKHFQRVNIPGNTFSGNLAIHNTFPPSPLFPAYGYTEILHPNEIGYGGIHLLKFFAKDSLPTCNAPNVPLPITESAIDSCISLVASISNLPVPTPLPAVWTTRTVPFCQVMGCDIPDFKIHGTISTCADSVLLKLDSLPGQNVVWNTGATTHSVWVGVPGKYKVFASGVCAIFSDSIEVTHNEIPDVGPLQSSLSICPGDSVRLQVFAFPDLRYLWISTVSGDTISKSHVAWFYNKGQDTVQLSNIRLTVERGGCNESRLVAIKRLKPNPPVLPVEYRTCKSDTSFRFFPTPTSSNWFWISSSGDTIGESTVLVEQSGKYQLVYQNSGCPERDTITVQLGVQLLGEVQVSVNNISTDSLSVSFPVDVSFNVPPGARDILWKCADDPDFNPGGIRSALVATGPGTYSCQADYMLANGCRATGTNQIILIKKPERLLLPLEIPNLVILRSGTVNSTFFIRHLDQFPDNKLEIFDRWGKRIYKTQGYANEWPLDGGIFNGSYFYLLSVDGMVYKGWLVVME